MQRRFFGLDSAHESEQISLLDEAIGAARRQALAAQPEATAVARPGISVGDYFVGEKAEYVDITVSLSAPGLQTVQVSYRTTDVTASDWAGNNDRDYVAASGVLTFAPGETSQTVRVSLIDNPLSEALQRFRFLLSNPVNSEIYDGDANVFIFDNDLQQATPSIWVRDAYVDEVSGKAVFVVSLGQNGGQSSASTVSVQYASSNGEALAGSDYTASSGTLSFAPGESLKLIEIAVSDDALAEGLERFGLTLSNASGATLGRASAQAFIQPNDANAVALPRISVGNYTVGENEGYVDVVVNLSAPGQQTVYVGYRTADITASDWSGNNEWDYLSTSGTLAFAPGETSKVVRIELLDGQLVENAQSFNVILQTPVNGVIAQAKGTVRILDNDSLQATPQVYVRDVVVDEASGQAVFHITLGENGGQASTGVVRVDFATQAQTATAATDFKMQSGTLVFQPGETVKTVVVDIVNDSVAEGFERLQLNLSNAVGASLGRSSALAEITANDSTSIALPRVNVGDYVIGENQGYVDVVISLSAPGQQIVRVDYRTADVTASDWSGNNEWDYLGNTGTVEFAPGETSKVVRIELVDGQLAERGQSFNLLLQSPVNAVIGQAKSNILILDNDDLQATPQLYVRDLVVDEASGKAQFVVSLGESGGQVSVGPISVDFATQALSATAGSDFVARTGTLTFQPGETMKTVVIDLVNDSTAEGLERLQLNLSNAVGASIAQGSALAEILANDSTPQAQPRISVGDAVVDEGQGFMEFVVTLSAPGQQTVRVGYYTSDVTASDWSGNNEWDYLANSGTLEFAPGETTKTVRIELVDNLLSEPLQNFSLLLRDPSNAVIAKERGQIWIVDNDDVRSTPELWIRDLVVDEKDGRATFVVSLGENGGQSSNGVVTVNYGTVAGTATAGSDFIARSGTLTFQPGETMKTVVVDLVDDATREGWERFQVQLSAPSGATLGRGSAQAEIRASDATAVAQPRIDVSDHFVNEQQGYVDVVVTLSSPGQQIVRAEYYTADLTATDWSGSPERDFVPSSGNIEFAVGETTKVVRIPLFDNLVTEALQSFSFVVRTPTNAVIGDGVSNIVLFDNDSIVETPGLFVRSMTVDEAAGTASFIVTLGENGAQASNNTIIVDYATTNDSAVAGSDFLARSGTLTFLPGETLKTVVVDLLDDGIAETLESFNLLLTNANGAHLVQPVGQTFIGANDGVVQSQPRLLVESTTADETDGYLEVVVRLNAPSDRQVGVNWSISNFSADTSSDFKGVTSGSLQFQPGETVKTVRFELLNDLVTENLESFTFNLQSPVNATIAQAQTRIHIADNDNVVTTPELHVQDLFVDESAGTATFVVSLGRHGGQSGNETVQVDFSTADGSARAGLDYVARSGQLVFAPGESIKTVVVPILNDTLHEGREGFTLRLSNPIGAVLADLSGLAVIGGSDGVELAQPVVSIADRVVAEGDGYVELVVQLSAPSASDVTMNYVTVAGTSGTTDYVSLAGSLRFSPGETLKVVRIEISDDITTEALESFQLRLQSLVGGSFGTGNPTTLLATINVADNDAQGVRVMAYGLGDDEYRLNSATDVIIEGPDGGNDTLFSPLRSYTLPSHVENGVITTANAANLFGNELDNLLLAGAGDNRLNGSGGIDTASYQNSALAVSVSLAISVAQNTLGSGMDTITLIENLTGSAHADTLTGNSVWNVINGGAGADTMSGGDGSDSYYVDNTGDLVVETNADVRLGGSDWVYSSLPAYTLGDNVENGIILRSTGGNLFGNGLNNTLVAGAGDNRLSGSGGVDTASYANAGAGVTVDLSINTAQNTGGSGSDTLLFIENLIGSAYDDVLTGNGLWNLLDGGAGADTMTGGAGSDTYYVDHLGDQVIETDAVTSSGGADWVYSRLASYTLGTNIENGAVEAADGSTLIGNGLDNVLMSGLGGDVLNGMAGTDTVSYQRAPTGVSVSLAITAPQATGGSGLDQLISIENMIGSSWNDDLRGNDLANLIRGGMGSDVIRGGLGNDLLYGGPGNLGEGAADYFVFDTTPNGSTNYDRIYSLEAGGVDKIVLAPAVFAAIGATLEAAEFRASAGGNAADANDFILFDTQTGNLFYDADGSGAGTKILFARLLAWTGAVDASDFLTTVPPTGG
jgi:Ca2+-binding RTX toxin-like protein